ncbi:hypothetical protein [Rhodococcus marinonascens]|uniref:hypothetical protein n=1 Tax=Rhodococcus marinonascens TaxID=38311 RepID=UPI000A821C46|nr:hypothetical protein [Rhodococcus marinonascens]
MLLVISVALLGPPLVSVAIRRLGGPLRRSSSAALALAALNSDAAARRLAAAIIPLALAVAIGAVQIFAQDTVGAAADEQSRKGTITTSSSPLVRVWHPNWSTP